MYHERSMTPDSSSYCPDSDFFQSDIEHVFCLDADDHKEHDHNHGHDHSHKLNYNEIKTRE